MADAKKLRIAQPEHTPESILADSLQIVGDQVRKLKMEGELSNAQVRTLSELVDMTLRLAKEDRERKLGERFDQMSDEQLEATIAEMAGPRARIMR